MRAVRVCGGPPSYFQKFVGEPSHWQSTPHKSPQYPIILSSFTLAHFSLFLGQDEFVSSGRQTQHAMRKTRVATVGLFNYMFNFLGPVNCFMSVCGPFSNSTFVGTSTLNEIELLACLQTYRYQQPARPLPLVAFSWYID